MNAILGALAVLLLQSASRNFHSSRRILVVGAALMDLGTMIAV
jgi:hypothetical protein